MNSTAKSIAILFLFVAGKSNVNAQLDLSKWQLGINAGVFIYQGDLTPTSIGSYKTPGPVLGINISRVLTASFALRGNIVVGKLNGDDAKYHTPAYRQQRNFRFIAPLGEASGLIVWNILSNNGNELGLRFSPYIFAGAGVSFLNVSRDFSRINKDVFTENSKEGLGLAIDMVRTPPTVMPVLPMGIGVEYYLTPKLSLTGETNFRYTFTDYLDGFSYAANATRKDFYHSHTIGVVYRFAGNDKLGCPTMKY